MAIDGYSFATIADNQIDTDSPIDEPLMRGMRDSLEFLKRWVGKNYIGGAVADHNHDNANSKAVAYSSLTGLPTIPAAPVYTQCQAQSSDTLFGSGTNPNTIDLGWSYFDNTNYSCVGVVSIGVTVSVGSAFDQALLFVYRPKGASTIYVLAEKILQVGVSANKIFGIVSGNPCTISSSTYIQLNNLYASVYGSNNLRLTFDVGTDRYVRASMQGFAVNF